MRDILFDHKVTASDFTVQLAGNSPTIPSRRKSRGIPGISFSRSHRRTWCIIPAGMMDRRLHPPRRSGSRRPGRGSQKAETPHDERIKHETLRKGFVVLLLGELASAPAMPWPIWKCPPRCKFTPPQILKRRWHHTAPGDGRSYGRCCIRRTSRWVGGRIARHLGVDGLRLVLVSDEPWGWACYHYGTWVDDPAVGWVWVPGVEWAPHGWSGGWAAGSSAGRRWRRAAWCWCRHVRFRGDRPFP